MKNHVPLGMECDNWPPEVGDMRLNEGGREHLLESDYMQTKAYGRESGQALMAGGLSLAHALSVTGEAVVASGLDEDPRVRQSAFFKGMLEAGWAAEGDTA